MPNLPLRGANVRQGAPPQISDPFPNEPPRVRARTESGPPVCQPVAHFQIGSALYKLLYIGHALRAPALHSYTA